MPKRSVKRETKPKQATGAPAPPRQPSDPTLLEFLASGSYEIESVLGRTERDLCEWADSGMAMSNMCSRAGLDPSRVRTILCSEPAVAYRVELGVRRKFQEYWVDRAWDRLEYEATRVMLEVMLDPDTNPAQKARMASEVLDRHPERRFIKGTRVEQRTLTATFDIKSEVLVARQGMEGIYRDMGGVIDGLLSAPAVQPLPEPEPDINEFFDAPMREPAARKPVPVRAPGRRAAYAELVEGLF